MEQRHVEFRIEQDDAGVDRIAGDGRDAHRTVARSGDHMGIGHDVAGGHRHATAGGAVPTDDREHPDGARLGEPGDLARGFVRGLGDRRSRQRLETDEDIGETQITQQLAELARDRVGWRQNRIERADGGRRLGGLGQARHRPDRQQAAGQPDHEQGLRGAGQTASDPIGRSEETRAQRSRGRPPDGRADQFADADGHEQHGEHDVRPDVDGDRVERLDESGDREDRERAAADCAQQTADLGQRTGAEPEDDGEDDQDDGHEVQRVHGPIVAQGS